VCSAYSGMQVSCRLQAISSWWPINILSQCHKYISAAGFLRTEHTIQITPVLATSRLCVHESKQYYRMPLAYYASTSVCACCLSPQQFQRLIRCGFVTASSMAASCAPAVRSLPGAATASMELPAAYELFPQAGSQYPPLPVLVQGIGMAHGSMTLYLHSGPGGPVGQRAPKHIQLQGGQHLAAALHRETRMRCLCKGNSGPISQAKDCIWCRHQQQQLLQLLASLG
jgi:hypothetical protein